MKITTYASAAIIALAMSVGSLSAEEQNSAVEDIPGADSAAAIETPFSLLNDVPSASPMTEGQLDETVGVGTDCGFRRRWFHRKKIVYPQVAECI